MYKSFPCSSSREFGRDIPLFIHRISLFVFPKGSVLLLFHHRVLADVGLTRSVYGTCPCPHPPLMVWYVQLIAVRDPLPPSRLPRSPAGSCAPSFQEGNAPRERGQSPRDTCSGKSWSLPPGLTSPLISRVPFAGNSTSLSG